MLHILIYQLDFRRERACHRKEECTRSRQCSMRPPACMYFTRMYMRYVYIYVYIYIYIYIDEHTYMLSYKHGRLNDTTTVCSMQIHNHRSAIHAYVSLPHCHARKYTRVYLGAITTCLKQNLRGYVHGSSASCGHRVRVTAFQYPGLHIHTYIYVCIYMRSVMRMFVNL
jgi:hypothetical protein